MSPPPNVSRTTLQRVRTGLVLIGLAILFGVVFLVAVVALLDRIGGDDPSAGAMWAAILAGAAAGWAATYVPWRVARWRGWLRRGDAARSAARLLEGLS
ncbi:MAG: hypothetical protein AAF594_15030 [Bacteroidota bacterium]